MRLVEVLGGPHDGALVQVAVDVGEPLPDAVYSIRTGGVLRLVGTPAGPKYTPLAPPASGTLPDHCT